MADTRLRSVVSVTMPFTNDRSILIVCTFSLRRCVSDE